MESFHNAHLLVQMEAGAKLKFFVYSCVAVSEAVELRKHTANDAKCTELGWVSISLVVGSYGECGKEAQQCLSRLASHLAIHNCMPKSGTLCKAEHLPDEGKLQGNFL